MPTIDATNPARWTYITPLDADYFTKRASFAADRSPADTQPATAAGPATTKQPSDVAPATTAPTSARSVEPH